ncbi:MAG: hypothetical protein Q7J65_09325, partial [Candidatus Marinimicrobia bacterium]|nr:hypothetical protein [Candidatus Neomarinimicrobiota bacterium]
NIDARNRQVAACFCLRTLSSSAFLSSLRSEMLHRSSCGTSTLLMFRRNSFGALLVLLKALNKITEKSA